MHADRSLSIFSSEVCIIVPSSILPSLWRGDLVDLFILLHHVLPGGISYPVVSVLFFKSRPMLLSSLNIVSLSSWLFLTTVDMLLVLLAKTS